MSAAAAAAAALPLPLQQLCCFFLYAAAAATAAASHAGWHRPVLLSPQALMRAQLQRIKDTEGLSDNVFEIVSKSLKD